MSTDERDWEPAQGDSGWWTSDWEPTPLNGPHGLELAESEVMALFSWSRQRVRRLADEMRLPRRWSKVTPRCWYRAWPLVTLLRGLNRHEDAEMLEHVLSGKSKVR